MMASRFDLVRRSALALGSLLLWAPVLAAQEELPPIREVLREIRFPELTFRPPRAETHRLRSGVTVHFVEDHTLPMVNLFARFDGGYALFPRELYAAATALPGLLRAGGTLSLSPDSVDFLLDHYALLTSFGGGGESTSSTLNTLSRHLEPALALWGEMLRRPGFDSLEVEVWRDRQREGALRRKDDPGRLAFSEFNRIMFGDHPIGWEMREEDLAPERFSREALQEVHRRTYCPEHLVLGVVGDVPWRVLSPLLEGLTRDWPSCPAPLPEPLTPEMRREGGVFLIPRDLPQSTVVMAEPGGVVQGLDEAFFDSRIANSILGGSGFSSRLLSRVRTEKGYAYSASSLWTTPSRYEGIVGAVTQTRSETTVAAIRLILDTMEEMRREAPSAAEVDHAIAQIVNGFVFNFQDPSQIVSRRMMYQAQGLPEDWLERYLEGIQRVRPSGVRRVFEREVHPDRMVILILGDPEAFDAPLETLGTVTIWDVEGIGNGEDARGLPGPSGISGYPRGGPRYPR